MEMLEFFKDYLVLVIVGICWCVGFIVKKWVKDVDNKWIPTICAVLGVIISAWVSGWTITPEVILGGLVSGLAATGTNELLTQHLNK